MRRPFVSGCALCAPPSNTCRNALVEDRLASLARWRRVPNAQKIIDNKNGIANGNIYNIGNPKNNYSVRELAQMMLDLAMQYPEYQTTAKKVKMLDTTAEA